MKSWTDSQPRAGLLTATQVAEYLGVHRKTIYAWIRTRGLPCVRLGGCLRFRWDDVLRWASAREEG